MKGMATTAKTKAGQANMQLSTVGEHRQENGHNSQGGCTQVNADRLAAVISAILTDRHGKQITARLRDENSGKNYNGCGGAQHCSGRDGA